MHIDNYDALMVEKTVLKFWDNNKIYVKAKDKGKGKKKYYFLDGPPYTSGKIHLGHAWNKALKDMVLRYKRMAGFDVWDRAGYDMHGMPTEHAVEKKLGIKNKDEIPKFGIKKFVEECRNFALTNLKQMNKDFIRIGTWMDYDDPYMTISKSYIEGEWWLVKKAHENGRLYQGEKTMHWCARCATALAKHELEYQNITDDSIFLKFPIVGAEKEFLIIWTTTPWTIPYNLGVMVNPKLEYVKAKVEGETWIVAKALAGGLIASVADKKFEIIEEFTGEKLKGIKYHHPLEKDIKDFKEIAKKTDKLHSVVLSEEYVDTTAGSGLVHMAPGCGPEDYEIGHREGIPPFNNLDENGIFPKSMGRFAGLKARDDDHKFIEALEKTGCLIATTKVEHDYAHCWRCKEAVIFRTTKQWFFKIEDLKETMRELNKDIYWVPGFAGTRSFDSWLNNLRDNGITRQRYWGTPLPVWMCECGKYDVIGSIDELKKKAGKLPKDLHKPWIDEVKWKCSCGKDMKKIPDILDVWIDAGSASWNCLNYPKETALFKKLFPADFILEGIDQIRGWFNLLFVASMVSMERPSFKAVYMHGFVNDAKGRKMSKSLGNIISPYEVIDKYGADTMRYYMLGAANPGINMNYNNDDVKLKHKNLGVLWNLHKFIIDFSATNNLKLKALDNKKFSLEDRYIVSKMSSTVEKTTERYDKYFLNEAPWLVEDLFLELSRTYIHLVREKTATGTEEEKQIILDVMAEVMLNVLKMFSPVVPFITEEIYQNMKKQFKLKEESIHLYNWPSADKKMIDDDLEKKFTIAKDVIQSILAGREKAQLGVRWPLKAVSIVTIDADTKDAVVTMEDIIKNKTNVKKIIVMGKFQHEKTRLKQNVKAMERDHRKHVPQIIARLMQENEASIRKKLESGSYKMKVENKEIELTKEHLVFEKIIPKNFIEVDCRHCGVFLDVTRTKDLEAEGFAREIARRVQMLRKKTGLEKKDRILLCIASENEIVEMISNFSEYIQEKCGGENIHITSKCKEMKYKSLEKIKGKLVQICFEVVELS